MIFEPQEGPIKTPREREREGEEGTLQTSHPRFTIASGPLLIQIRVEEQRQNSVPAAPLPEIRRATARTAAHFRSDLVPPPSVCPR